MLVWKPPSGHIALIEPADGHACLTGIVLEDDHDDRVVVDLGGSPRPAELECRCTASFFSPDALYRTDATITRHEGTDTVIDLTIHDVERVQRRTSPRAQVALPVVLSNFDDPDPEMGGSVFSSVTGTTVDLAEGGCRVATDKAFPAGCDPTVTLHLSESEELIALAAILEERLRDDARYEYRLVFIDPDDDHRERLAKVVANAQLEVA